MSVELHTKCQPGSDVYYALTRLPGTLRARMTGLLSLYFTVLDIPNTVTDPGVARIKLQWWREQISKMLTDTPQHPLLANLVANLELCQADLKTLDHIVVSGIEKLTHSDVPSWEHYRENVSRQAQTLVKIINLADKTRQAPSWAQPIATSIMMGNTLRDFRTDVMHDRFVLPMPLFTKHGIAMGQWDNLPNCLAEIMAACREAYFGALAEVSKPYHMYVVLLVWAKIQLQTLEMTARGGYKVMEEQVELTPIRKLWTAWWC